MLTGDLSTLSEVDMNVLALCHTMIQQRQKTGMLHKSPSKVNEFQKKEDKKVNPSEKKSDSGWGDWINPTNIKTKVYKSDAKTQLKEDKIGVFLMTSDFAMQNVALQIGIPLLTPDGQRINHLKTFVQECFACLSIERDPFLIKIFQNKLSCDLWKIPSRVHTLY